MSIGYTNYDVFANCNIDDSCSTVCEGIILARISLKLLRRLCLVGLLTRRPVIFAGWQRKMLVADHDPPVLTLLGEVEDTVHQECGRSFRMIDDSCSAGSYADLGVTAQDAVDGDVTSTVTVDRTVDLTAVGVQRLTYTARDSGGREASIVRVVTVVGVGCMDHTCAAFCRCFACSCPPSPSLRISKPS